MIASLITKLFSFILSLLSSLVRIIISPISLLINNTIPDLHSVATTISNFINNSLGNIGYFFSWLGPLTKSAVRLELSIISAFFTIYLSYIVIHTSIRLIRKIRGMF